jgi:hypothetical protein
LADYLLEQIRGKFKPGDSFTVDDVEADRSTRHSRQTALWQLSQKGYLDKPRGKGTKGRYVLRSRKAPNGKAPAPVRRPRPVRVNPVQSIYDLLEFMAKAEPSLRRAAKILEAVDNA